MKALILNSGMGRRMGNLTTHQPKCMTELNLKQTILSRQIELLEKHHIKEVVITTGLFCTVLEEYVKSLTKNIKFEFVYNDLYDRSNYIYSIYQARKFLQDDIILMHGDLVFEETVLEEVLSSKTSCMVVSSTVKLPEKDFKAVVTSNKIEKIGIEFFENALSAQPLYKLLKNDWFLWLDKINEFCNNGNIQCYAENAFNQIAAQCSLYPMDIEDRLCQEIDCIDDLEIVKNKMSEVMK